MAALQSHITNKSLCNCTPIPNPILNVATVKTTFTFTTALTTGMPLTAVS